MKKEVSRVVDYLSIELRYNATFDNLIAAIVALKEERVKPEYTYHTVEICNDQILFRAYGMETDEEYQQRKNEEEMKAKHLAKIKDANQKEFELYLKLKEKYDN